MSGMGEDVEDLKTETSDLKDALDTKAPVITDTASGPIASFPDGAENVPIKVLKVGVEPVQDLHGYDKPWPAGGGKNLISYPMYFTSEEKNGCTSTVAENGTVAFSGTPSTDTIWNLKRRVDTTGDGSLFLPEGEYILNGCPSGGSANTYQMSVISANGSALGTDRGEGATFTIPSGGMNIGVQIFIKGSYNPNSLKIQPMIRLSSVTDGSFAPYSNICPISPHTQAKVVISPTTDEQDGVVYTIPFNQPVYGGTLDVGTGELVVDRQIVDLGTLTWTKLSDSVGDYFRTSITGIKGTSKASDIARTICSIYNISPSNNVVDKSIAIGTILGGAWVYARDLSCADVTAFVTKVNGQTLVYELATPITISLTPTQITTVLGTNNIFADTGDVECEYRADTKLYINKKITEAIANALI